jgi:hypothetical protein
MHRTIGCATAGDYEIRIAHSASCECSSDAYFTTIPTRRHPGRDRILGDVMIADRLSLVRRATKTRRSVV